MIRPYGILFDIDNTLTNTEGLISESLVMNIKKLSERGIKLGVCTGRTYPMIKNYILSHFPSDSIHVMSGGGEIRSGNGKVLWKKNISASTISNIALFCKRNASEYFYSDDNTVYGSQIIISTIRRSFWNIDTSTDPKKKAFSSPLIFVSSSTANFKKFLDGQTDINVVQSKIDKYGFTNFDITYKNINKYTGAMVWSDINKLNLKDVIAFGDSDNDYELIKNVGFGIAMGNATKKIRDVSKLVIGHTDKDGLSTFISESILSK